jgi:hypothetical protein
LPTSVSEALAQVRSEGELAETIGKTQRMEIMK